MSSFAEGVRFQIFNEQMDVEDVLMYCRRIGEFPLHINFHSSGICGRRTISPNLCHQGMCKNESSITLQKVHQ